LSGWKAANVLDAVEMSVRDLDPHQEHINAEERHKKVMEKQQNHHHHYYYRRRQPREPKDYSQFFIPFSPRWSPGHINARISASGKFQYCLL
jgi:hypothetical protein